MDPVYLLTVNAAYLLRGFGINAFVLAGDTIQRIAAAIGGLSVLAILTAWSVLCWQLLHLT